MILPPPVTSDATLDDVEAYLDRVNAVKKPPLPKGDDAPDQGEARERVQRSGLAEEQEVGPGQ